MIIHDFLKSKPELTYDEVRVFKRIPQYLQKLCTNLSKRGNYQEKYLHSVEQLFNEDVYYKHVEVKYAFSGNYVLYESNGDQIGNRICRRIFFKNKALSMSFN